MMTSINIQSSKQTSKFKSIPLLVLAFYCAFIKLNTLADIRGIGATVPLSSKMELSVGNSTIVKLKARVERISLSNPGIAYIKLLTPNQIMLIGRNTGKTNLFLWFPPEVGSKPGTPSEIVGTEISVGLPPPPYITTIPTMEILSGDRSELIYIGNPSEKINNAKSGRTTGPSTDMPETCLSPGCI